MEFEINEKNSAKKAEQELVAEGQKVKIIWKGPLKEDDRDQQIQLVENFTIRRVDGMVLAPLDAQALVRPVENAQNAGIPVVIIDSPLAGEEGTDFIAYVGTDNYAAGRLAGERLGKVMDGRGRALLLRYMESSASTREREDGFIDGLKDTAPGIELIDPRHYSGADVISAKSSSENLLTAHEGRFDGIFCPNESSTAGMLLALEDRQLAGKVRFVGFDIRPQLITAMKEGKIHGLVIQNPFQMGYRGVQTLLTHAAGGTVERKIDTGSVMVTSDNLETPDIQRLIHPALIQ